MSLVEKVKTLCAEKNITVAALERRLDFGNGTIRKWDNAFPSGDKLAKVAQFFNVSVDFLLGLSEDRYDYERDPEERSKIIPPQTLEQLNQLTGSNFREVWRIWQVLRTSALIGEAEDRLPEYDKHTVSNLYILNWEEETKSIVFDHCMKPDEIMQMVKQRTDIDIKIPDLEDPHEALSCIIDQLNEKGIRRLIGYAEDLRGNPEYKKKESGAPSESDDEGLELPY